jgi:hypothetical protein
VSTKVLGKKFLDQVNAGCWFSQQYTIMEH